MRQLIAYSTYLFIILLYQVVPCSVDEFQESGRKCVPSSLLPDIRIAGSAENTKEMSQRTI